MRQPFSGTAERIFMKLLPNDSGENGSFHRHTQMGARPPNNYLGAKNYTVHVGTGAAAWRMTQN